MPRLERKEGGYADIHCMAWGGDAIDGVSLIDLRQKLKDITAQQALLLDQVLEHMDDEILNAQLKAMMDEKQALQEQIAAAEQSQTHNAAQKSRMAELREWMAKLEVNQQYSDEQVRMAVERITVVDAETIRIRFRYQGRNWRKNCDIIRKRRQIEWNFTSQEIPTETLAVFGLRAFMSKRD